MAKSDSFDEISATKQEMENDVDYSSPTKTAYTFTSYCENITLDLEDILDQSDYAEIFRDIPIDQPIGSPNVESPPIAQVINRESDDISHKAKKFKSTDKGFKIPAIRQLEWLPPSAKSDKNHWLVGYKEKGSCYAYTFHCRENNVIRDIHCMANSGTHADIAEIPVGVTKYTLNEFRNLIHLITLSYPKRKGVLDCYIWAVYIICNIPFRPYFEYVEDNSHGCIYLYNIKCDASDCLCKTGTDITKP